MTSPTRCATSSRSPGSPLGSPLGDDASARWYRHDSHEWLPPQPAAFGHDGLVRRSRFEHTIVLGIAIELSMVMAFGVVIGQPRWRLAPFAPTADRNYFDARAWSPDGSAVMTAAGGGRFEIIRSDGALLLADTEGMTPLWIDDRTVIALETVDASTSRLVRIDTHDGSRHIIGGQLPLGHLVGGEPGRVAHRTVVGPLVTTVLDPVDGRVLGRLAGYRARTWTNDGSLIVRKPEPSIQNSHYGAGALFDWRPGEDPRPLAPGLIDLGEVSPLSPSGDAIACVCARASSLGRDPAGAIYRVPIDGSPPTELVPFRRAPKPTFGTEPRFLCLTNPVASVP